MFAAVFSAYYITIFSYNSPLEFSFKAFELFFFEGYTGLNYLMINLFFLQKERLMKMDMGELFIYFRSGMVKECLIVHGLEKCLELTLL